MSGPNGRKRAGRLVIVGAGHAHLGVIRALGRLIAAGHEATVVTPEDFWYSGLATGMLGGRHEVEADRVDVAGLVGRVGARLVRDEVTAIDLEAQTIGTLGGEAIPFDVVSIDVGSRVPTERVPGLAEHAFTVKPIRRLAELRADLGRRLRAGDRPIRVLVIGGGATACEVAANVRALAGRDHGADRLVVTLAAAGDRLMRGFPAGAARAVERHLRRRDVVVRLGSRIERVDAGAAIAAGSVTIGFDVAVAAIGLVPAALVAVLGLPTDDEGALLVDESLRSVATPWLFGAGDCVNPRGRRLPKIGVVAVRQSAVLAANLGAALEGRRLRRYRPQRRHLLILNLGTGTGLACWGPLWWQGRAMLWWKDRLDRSFLRRFQ